MRAITQRLQTLYLNRSSFFYSTKCSLMLNLISNIDTANVCSITQIDWQPYLTVYEKLSYFNWRTMYTLLDEFSREFLFTLSEWGLGLSGGIIVTSLLLKLIFLYPNIKVQLMQKKMQLLKPDQLRFREKMRIAQMTENRSLMKQAQKDFSKAKKQRGIESFHSFLSILQIPFMITWFFSLRYIVSLPEIYPQVQTDGYLWFSNLSNYDPYFILPFGAALFTSLSIAYNPNLRFSPTFKYFPNFIKYLKFLPFTSLPITCFFPAALSLYWLVLSLCQALLTIFFRSKNGMAYFDQQKSFKPIPKVINVVLEEKQTISEANSKLPKYLQGKVQFLKTLSQPRKKDK